jgi:mRNA interferase MazF
MVSPAVGKVILVPFPFSDLSKSKMRPAVVLADAGRGDWILCQITSNPYGDPNALAIKDENFAEGSLRIASFARPGKLFTASSGLMLSEVGMLKEDVVQQIIDTLIKLLHHDAGKSEPERDPMNQ